MDLNRATTFVRVVENGGFTRAAEALGLPPSSVSRSVAKLEEDLGITLLERTTRKVALTDAGRAYFERARDALAGLEEANALALDAAREVHGLVRVALPPDFAGKIGGVIATFGAMHPRIRIECTFTTNGGELVGDVVDLAIQFGKLPDSSLVARRLGNSAHQLYASPAYLEERGTPKQLADLALHEGIVFKAIAGETRWELEGPKGPEHVDIPARLVGDHMQLVLDATLAGLGIAMLPQFFGDVYVAQGKLVQVLPKYSTENPMHVLTHASRHLPRRVSLFRDFISEALSSSCKAHGALK
ncbi:MAG: LysR family transcriptional regulator [Kofleriaceae bacterium]